MTSLSWIAFAASAPGNGPIVVVWTSTGDPWSEYLDPDTFEKALSNVDSDEHEGKVMPGDLAFFAHCEVLTCAKQIFGIKLYRDQGRGRELSEAEYHELYNNGWWIAVEDFLRAVGPEGIVPCIVNDSMQGVITEIGQ